MKPNVVAWSKDIYKHSRHKATNVPSREFIMWTFETWTHKQPEWAKELVVRQRPKRSCDLQYSKAHRTPSSPQRRKACRAAWCCRSCRRSSRHGRPGPWRCSRFLHPPRSLRSWHSALGRGRGGEAENRFSVNPDILRSDNIHRRPDSRDPLTGNTIQTKRMIPPCRLLSETLSRHWQAPWS